MLSERNDIFFFLSLFLQTAASVPLVAFSLCAHTELVKGDRAGAALIWLMVDGEIRAGALLSWCTAAQQSETVLHGFYPWMRVGEDRRALGKMGGWACSIRKPWVSAGTAWCLAAGLWGTPHTKLSCLGSERTLGQALNSLEVNNWGGSSPRGSLMPFACFRCGQE